MCNLNLKIYIVRDWRLHGWRRNKTSVKKQASVKPEAHPISFAVGGQFTMILWGLLTNRPQHSLLPPSLDGSGERQWLIYLWELPIIDCKSGLAEANDK